MIVLSNQRGATCGLKSLDRSISRSPTTLAAGRISRAGFLHAVTAYGEAISSLTETLCGDNIKSRGFLSFRGYLSRYTVSDYFTNMMAEAKRMADNLSTVLYYY
jgi:hypothetical protein